MITADGIRVIDRKSIRDFVESAQIKGRTLDFGAGKQPYKDLVDGEYVPYECGMELPDGPYDNILCNQVLQYLPEPETIIRLFAQLLTKNGRLIITYATHWEEREKIDYWRITKAGMERMLLGAGFKIIRHESRHKIDFEDFSIHIGYGVIAEK